ncbi:nucleotidyl transferase AbiEii/AbiGii toxin family protein [Adlercreutzia sp. ZJ154]|uniref:nucleotidyl transferase AbiEii/AbiGii toxin family protein n=1 Tax=Adlercreutzia sp. ZJ154 TaxID=2709790 RepID=UPI0013EC0A62|nr:nucleotidyl transferase AbiEii/AbiGii toxin family protein [Adlercreutzia sp. ZJ154]
MKRPNSVRNLDMAIRRFGASEEDYLENRTAIANAIVGQMLRGAVMKGGSSLKIRFGAAGTRATTDLDAARSVGRDEFSDGFSRRLVDGWEGFTGRLVEMPKARPKNVPGPYVMQPYAVKLSYLGKPWCTVTFELGHNEIGDADNADFVVPKDAARMLEAMAFPEPAPVPLMTLRYQIAQKLHGASEPNSQRAHDLIDLQLIISNGEIDLHDVREVCERLFSYRRKQEWPPVIMKDDAWDSLYSEAAADLDVLPGADEAVAWANDLIRRIATA